jgi:hypothetical protein
MRSRQRRSAVRSPPFPSSMALRVSVSASPSNRASRARVVAFLEPFGRPSGLPDSPGLNRVSLFRPAASPVSSGPLVTGHSSAISSRKDHVGGSPLKGWSVAEGLLQCNEREGSQDRSLQESCDLIVHPVERQRARCLRLARLAVRSERARSDSSRNGNAPSIQMSSPRSLPSGSVLVKPGFSISRTRHYAASGARIFGDAIPTDDATASKFGYR